MFGAVLFELDKLDYISGAGRTVAAEAAKGIGGGIDLQGGCFVIMEGAVQPLVFVRLQTVML
nr:hypothetical protein [Paraflavitalea speifideiaquila]